MEEDVIRAGACAVDDNDFVTSRVKRAKSLAVPDAAKWYTQKNLFIFTPPTTPHPPVIKEPILADR